MDEYKKPKLKLKKFKKPNVKVSTDSPSMPMKVSEPPAGAKLKIAPVNMKMSDMKEPAKKKMTKKKQGTITRIKAKGGKYYQSDRIKEEIKTEQLADDLVEALRYGNEKRLNKAIKKSIKKK